LVYAKNFFWDGGATSIENQVIGPIQNPVEMHSALKDVIAKLNANADYKSKFKLVFGKNVITTALLMKAVAQFEKTILSGNSKFDLYKVGKATLTTHEANGLNLFLDEHKGDCTHCHTFGSTFTDFAFKDNGLDSIPKDSGRYRIPPFLVSNIGKFKTPSLRNIELTAPYMHDGRFKTLTECVEHYNSGFKNSPNLDINIANKTKGRMTTQEVADIVAFLKTLTDVSITTNKNFAK
jgi:cytochrome c peroxidase